jgi:hypothetical protein
MRAGYDGRWEEATVELRRTMKAWRDSHPQATFLQIEVALEEELSKLRAEMLSDLANASAAAEGETADGERVRCPKCGGASHRHGHRKRELKGQHDQSIRIERRVMTCARCRHTFSPSGQ